MKSELCIVAYVYGKYTHFIPLYIYSILRAYPDYWVKIFLPGINASNNFKLLNELKRRGFNRFEIIENFKICKHADYKKHARWLIPKNEFNEFKYVYVGDVDFIILPENPSILDFHVAQMKKSGLCYSNVVRKNTKKLTGLHFFEVEPYYREMDKIISDSVAKEIPSSVNVDVGGWNEKFLYSMVESAFGTPPTYKWLTRPHHGLHLGYFRIGGSCKRDGVKAWKERYPNNYDIFNDETYKYLQKNSLYDISQVMSEVKISMCH